MCDTLGTLNALERKHFPCWRLIDFQIMYNWGKDSQFCAVFTPQMKWLCGFPLFQTLLVLLVMLFFRLLQNKIVVLFYTLRSVFCAQKTFLALNYRL